MKARITPHQRYALDRLRRLSSLMGDNRWVYEKDSGAPAALDHLYRKGYVEREIRTGPRGGEHVYYRPLP
jgi:hypothetical protein